MDQVAIPLRRWRLADPLLEIREGETVEVETPLAELYVETWAELGLQPTRPLGSTPDSWHLTADRWVGVARLPKRDDLIRQLRITPKLDAADIFFLADYAFGHERNRISEARLEAFVAANSEQPAAQLIAWFLAELETFILRHLRRDYVVREEVFEARIRGRLLLGEYIQRYVTRGANHLAPCRFYEFTQDNLPNQILKRSLRELRRLALLVAISQARHELTQWADRLLPFLGAVSDQQINPTDFNRLRFRASLRHYAPIINKCKALLGRTYMTTQLGPHRQDAFLWNMPILFERALRGVFRTTPDVRLLPRSGKATILDPADQAIRSTSVWPDYILQTSGGKVILDAKYKDTRIVPDPTDDAIELQMAAPAQKIRVLRSDIYQAIAYGNHNAYKPAEIGLIYPVALNSSEKLPPPHRVEGFANNVWLLFIDIGSDARAHLDGFRRSIPGTRRSLELVDAA